MYTEVKYRKYVSLSPCWKENKMCFRYEAKMNASLPSILITNHYKSLRYDQNLFILYKRIRNMD